MASKTKAVSAVRKFEFSVEETSTYTVYGEGATVEEAARDAGRKFGTDPHSFETAIDDRSAFLVPGQKVVPDEDVTEYFDQGVEASYKDQG